jgi:hypothetical protein
MMNKLGIHCFYLLSASFFPVQDLNQADYNDPPSHERYTSPLYECIFFLFGLWGYWHCGHSWPIVPASSDSEDDCGVAEKM